MPGSGRSLPSCCDLDEVIADRQAEMMAEHRRSAERDDRAAVFGESLQLRNRLLERDAAELRAILRRNIGRRGWPPPAAATTAAAVGLRNAAVGEQQHVELRLEVAGVERRAGYTRSKGNSNCSSSQRTCPDGIEPPY